MIQVKEFLNYQEGQDLEINKWLEENKDKIDIIEIKYSVGTFPVTEYNGGDAHAYSGALIIYKEKEIGRRSIRYENYKPKK